VDGKMVKGETLGELAERVGFTYQVKRQVLGGARSMGRKTTDYHKALHKFLQSPTAYGIQKYIRGTDITAGLIQPTIPHRIKVNGDVYERGYVGHHTKQSAEALARGFRQDGHKAVTRKFKGGWQVFVKVDKRRF
jgi:cobalamin-dependent methionine synthase I